MESKLKEPEYRFIEVTCIRSQEQRAIRKWEAQGWEFVSQEKSKLQSVLKFRKLKGKWDQKSIAFAALVGTVAVLVLVAGVTTGFKDSPTPTKAVPTPTATTDSQSDPKVTETVPSQPEVEEPPSEEEPSITLEQQNAREQAVSYLDYESFSRRGLINQLVFEKFSKADATFAVDSLGIDWNDQAAKKARQYLEYKSFSKAGLIEQLVFEGFSEAQARYGVKQVGL